MTIIVTAQEVESFSHPIAKDYAGAFDTVQAVLDRYRITENRLRLAYFLAQVLHETGGLRMSAENLHYRAAGLQRTWPHRFWPIGPLDPGHYAMQPEKLADAVYGNRMGNDGNGDGFLYRGRGMMQLTGKDSYREATLALREKESDPPDLVANPDLALSADWALAIAAAIWDKKKCNEFADMNCLFKITHAINGGQIGWRSRAAWFRLVRRRLYQQRRAAGTAAQVPAADGRRESRPGRPSG